ncbi:VOC family protein [Aliishimia ponticola]|uniref:VOC family protein n=1 Tax=Aliishimia ponticola TaxID=2499833 RepID=A0A4S4NAR8_9RHOB|nr:VOC family protein [Aliishimia ponticola]THH35765.1 VOC family protein [Aliishimia ponticola]
MDQRISLITLGAKNAEALATFYDKMGWARVDSPDGIVVFDLIGQALGIYPLDKLAEDTGLTMDAMGHGAATLGYNVTERAQVAEVLAAAQSAGATILRPASDVFWGGHTGYFADPEGHVWEVSWNPFSTLGPNGEFRWNGYA